MSNLKNILEPGAIAGIFALGAWINRRADCYGHVHDPSRTPLLHEDDSEREQDTYGEPGEGVVAETARRKPQLRFHSRWLERYPFLLEIWYWLLIYWIYQGARAISARVIANNKPIFQKAEHHAILLLSLEHYLHIDIELSAQQFILTKSPRLIGILASIYYSHIIVGVAFYVYSYTYLPRNRYQAIRRTLALTNAIAFVILSLWRCTPPRLLSSDYGFIDVLHDENSGSAWTRNKFQLTIAAMPSLHFGNSTFLAFCLVVYSPHGFLRVIAPLWPVAMGVTVVATANHFVLDMVVGVVVIASAYYSNRVLLVLLPVERVFRMIWLEKPQHSFDGK